MIYLYKCDDCGDVIEIQKGMNEKGPSKCKTCNGSMRRIYNAPAVHYKGAGFYSSDKALDKPGDQLN